MKRSSFLKTSILTTSIPGMLPLLSESKVKGSSFQKGGREFYELRTYILKNETQQKLVSDYFEMAAIPAFNRLGIKNIGVFTELKPEGQTKVVALIPFGSVESYMDAAEKLNVDSRQMADGAAYLNAPASDPAYDRIESSLLFSFRHMPKILSPEKKQRIFELRRYESASEMASKKKIEMFNDAGEIDIFKKVGLTPVFFGESLIGPLRPNITYMLTFDDMAEHDKNWKTFGSDPKWKQISQMPEYADAKLVSRITSTFLVPTDFSQV